jgi:hypothetical protein
MTTYRTLRPLWHTARAALGHPPIVPPGEIVSLEYLPLPRRRLLIQLGAVEEIHGTECQVPGAECEVPSTEYRVPNTRLPHCEP